MRDIRISDSQCEMDVSILYEKERISRQISPNLIHVDHFFHTPIKGIRAVDIKRIISSYKIFSLFARFNKTEDHVDSRSNRYKNSLLYS